MLLEQRAALTLGHSAPHPELHAIVQRIGATLGHHRAVPADDGGLALRGATNEELIGIGRTAQSPGHPRDARLPINPVD